MRIWKDQKRNPIASIVIMKTNTMFMTINIKGKAEKRRRKLPKQLMRMYSRYSSNAQTLKTGTRHHSLKKLLKVLDSKFAT